MEKKSCLFKDKETRNLVLQALFDIQLLSSYSTLRNLSSLSTCSRVSIKSRCRLTHSFKSVFPKYGLSRMKFSSLALRGFICGVQKASW